MKYKIWFSLLGWILSIASGAAQHSGMGEHLMVHIYGAYDSDTTTLPGANVYWANTTEGTASDDNGIAHVSFYKELPHQLVVSYIGFHNDTILVQDVSKKHYYSFLINEEMLDAVEIIRKKRSQFISVINPIKTEILGEDELRKAACCDLSESFETNASVDVSYSDAVTGAKEIKLLGLDGVYVEMLQENVPALRGLATPFGLTYVPGPWMQSIYISKGAGTVLNGHESITGAINFRYKQPFDTDPFHIDLFANHLGRYEANIVSGINFSETESTVFAVNVGGQHKKLEGNGDGFLDKPLYDRFNIMNRWKFLGERANGQFLINYMRDDRTSGQVDFDPRIHKGGSNVYGLGLKTNRIDAYGKTGFFFADNPNQNVGMLYNFNWHDQQGYLGLRDYTGTQISGNATIFFQTIFKTTDHGFVTGANFHADKFDEQFDDIVLQDKEWNAGYFAEYTYSALDRIKLVTGLRLDYHSEFGLQVSPRIHFKWTAGPTTTVRLSAGHGFRSSRILGENISLMASSREFQILEKPGIESAWNTGASLQQTFKLGEREGSFGVDYFFTWFTNQVITDVDEGNNTAQFYNLDGKSFANSVQFEIGYEVVKGLDLRVAYKIDDVKVTLQSGFQPKPFNYLHKGLVVASYESPNELWQIDMNLDLHGKHHLPRSFEGDDHGEFSPSYTMLNLQVSKFWKNGIEIYAGAENITNFKQKNPILGADDPFADGFDTAQVWGPVTGGIFYTGFRYSLERKK